MVPENVFQAAVLRLTTPLPSSASPAELAAEEPRQSRQVAYYDEKLRYIVSMTLPHGAILVESGDEQEEREALERFLDVVQITTSATFVPHLPQLTTAGPSQPNGSLNFQTPTLSAPPGSSSLPSPRLGLTSSSIIPPNTPNPMPQMDENPLEQKKRYAGLEGVVVWEGVPNELDVEREMGAEMQRKRRRKGAEPVAVLRGAKNDDWAWRVVWQGKVPIAYLRTPVQNPLLALTAGLTLRPPHLARTHRRTNTVSSIDSMSLKSDSDHGEDKEDDGESIAEMEEVDLLGGLADEPLPSTRLPPSLRTSLALPPITPNSAASTSAYTSHSVPLDSVLRSTTNARRASAAAPTQPPNVLPTTLRKSFRTILGLSSGLRVRMRTVILPQLITLETSDDQDDNADAERRIVLCVELESGLGMEEGEADGYEIERIEVDVGGKGGKVEVEMVSISSAQVFPMRLGRVDQYNLLYAMSPAANHDVNEGSLFGQGQGDLQRPVSITVIGRPFHSEAQEDRRYPSESFSSRWNCTLDLSSFQQSLSSASVNRHSVPPMGKFPGAPIIAAPSNQIIGDKRYSLASLMSTPGQVNSPRSQALPKSGRSVSGRGPVSAYGNGTAQPLPPSAIAGSQERAQDAYRHADGEGLLVSVRLLPQGPAQTDSVEGESHAGTIRANEPFSVEIFVHNQTDEVRRLRIGAPGLETRRVSNQNGDLLASKANGTIKTSDAALREQFLKYLDSAPAIVALENDIRCGPLYPHTSQSARMRFIALRDGVHRIEKLRIVGVGPGDEFEYIMSPVTDVVVGSGSSL